MPSHPHTLSDASGSTDLPASNGLFRGALIGLASLAGLTILKLAFIDVIGRPTPFLLYFGAVMVAAWYGGMAAGLVTTALSAVLGYLGFIAGGQEASGFRVASQLVVFAIEGVTISWMTGRLARDRKRAVAAMADARDANRKLEAAMSGTDIGVTMQSLDGKLVYANDSAAQLIGLASPAEVLAAEPTRLMANFDMRDEHGQPMSFDRLPGRALARGEEAKEVLVQFTTRDRAEVRWSVVSAKAVRDDTSKPRFIVNVFRDVTERQRQQEALRISHEWFSTTLRSIGDAVIATDGQARITFVNSVAEALTGWSAAECSGRPLAEVFQIINEDTRVPTESPVERVLREGIVVGLANHTILIRQDASEIAIDDSAAPIRGVNGEVVGVVLVFRDVSEARRAAQRTEFLARASEELASSLDYTATLATVANLAVPTIADWCAVDMVEKGERRRLAVAHVDPSKVEWVHEINHRYPPDPNATTGVPNILRTGKPEMMARIPNALLQAAAKDEEHRQIIERLQLRSYVGVPLLCGGETVGVITMVMAESGRTYTEEDMALAMALAQRASIAVENARLYRAAEDARTTAELADKAKDDFLAMLGHELRNPLAPILTALELMKLRGGAGIAREREIVERQIRSVVRLVDDLLEVSRITRKLVMLNIEPIELGDVIAEGLELAEPLIAGRGHRVEIEVSSGLVVDGDAIRLAQVIANLLTNAAKYSDRGGTITVRGARIGDIIELRVRDRGIGISPAMLTRIFEVFVQEPQALDRAQGGLGLGLAIVKSLVQQHGGNVVAISEGTGKGSEFVVTLPASKHVFRNERPVEASPPVPSSGATVLLVDDNIDALEMMAAALELLGHEVHAVHNGHAALELVATVQPDIALLDLGLPGLDGYELARRLRAIPGLEHLRLVAITGYGQASDRERTAAAGFSAHLVKPVEVETVNRVIEQWCGEAKRSHA